MTLFTAVLCFIMTICKSQIISMSTMPFGCSEFKYITPKLKTNKLPPIINSAFKQVDEYVEYLYTSYNVPSISYGIVYDDELIHYTSYGSTDLNTKEPPTEHSIYRIGSITKTFTSLMAYILRDQGIISIDDPIYEFNNNFRINNPWGINKKEKLGQTVTIKQLITALSGLPRTTPCDINITYNECIDMTTNQIFDRIASWHLIHATDTQPSYSNLAFAIAGNLLTEITDNYHSFEDAVHELIIDKLEMGHTGLYLSHEQKPYAAKGYSSNKVEQEWIDLGWEAPAGQLFSSVYDLSILIKQFFASYPSKFQREISSKIEFVTSPQSLREMLRASFVNPDGKSGYGPVGEMQIINGHWLIGKGGGIPGFSTNFVMIPELKLGVIALLNHNAHLSADAFTYGTVEILLPAFKSWIRSQQSKYTADYGQNIDITQYVGSYSTSTGIELFEIFIDEDNNNLMLTSYLGGYGILTLLDENKMIYNDLRDSTESCWMKILSAVDGTVIEFITDSNDDIIGATLQGIAPVELVKQIP